MPDFFAKLLKRKIVVVAKPRRGTCLCSMLTIMSLPNFMFHLKVLESKYYNHRSVIQNSFQKINHSVALDLFYDANWSQIYILNLVSLRLHQWHIKIREKSSYSQTLCFYFHNTHIYMLMSYIWIAVLNFSECNKARIHWEANEKNKFTHSSFSVKLIYLKLTHYTIARHIS